MRRTYLRSQQLLGALICALGMLMLVLTLARGGGPLALGVLVGACFTALGAARIWLGRARQEAPPPR